MVKTIVFNKDFKVKDSLNSFDHNLKNFYWTHMDRSENVEKVLMKCLNIKKSLVEDLLEEQRPNVKKFKDFEVIVVSLPSKKTKVIQLTFILSKNNLLSISSRESESIIELLQKVTNDEVLLKSKDELFAVIVGNIVERSIKKIEEIREKIEKKELKILNKNIEKDFLAYVSSTKNYLMFSSKIVRGDLEVINEINIDQVDFIDLIKDGEQLKDRMLFLNDNIEIAKESINNLNNTYMNTFSFKLNKRMYTLTIIGALLIIPTMISGLFGMNVLLPALSFYEILGLTTGLCVVSGIILKLFF